MRNKITKAADAVSIIQPGDTLCTSGFVGVGVPEELLLALEQRFAKRAPHAISRLSMPRANATGRTGASTSWRTRGC